MRDEGLDVDVSHGDWRPGDQRVYISDIRRAGRHYGPSRVRGTGARAFIAGA